MTKQTSRRDFLGLSAFGVVAALASPELAQPAGPGQEMPKAGSEISIWVTADEDRYAPAPRGIWKAAAEASAGDPIRLDPGVQFQPILGFGGSFTDAACYTFRQLAPAARADLFHELFHPSEMGLSVGRICVGASDYATKLYGCDEGEPDPQLKRFSIEHDREFILPVLRQARQVN